MDGSLTPTGGALGSNVNNFSSSKAAATVVDAFLNYPALASRMLRNGIEFSGDGRGEQPLIVKTIKISGRSQFEWFDGLDPLNSSAENVAIQLQFADAHASMPLVEILTESIAREGSGEDIDYPAFEYQDALNETVEGLSIAMFGVGGSGDEPLGLEGIVDNGTNLATFGGQTRATYDPLDATVTASGGSMTLAKLATLVSTISDQGPMESPTVAVTNDTIADLYQQFLTPTVNYNAGSMAVNGLYPEASKAPSMNQGFGRVNTYAGIPIIRDKRSTSGVLYMLNENYLKWHGRTRVPKNFKEFVSPVSLGKSKVIDGQASMTPSKYHGFFFQEKQMMPNQAGILGRFFVFGQMTSFQPQRQGKLTGITSVA